MGIYDYIIVGGGISGLFMAYKLSQTDNDVLLLESSNRLGGRLLTKVEKGVQFELGGARISSKHTKVLSLLKEFELDKDLIKLPDDISYKIKGPRINFYSLIKELVEGSKLYTKKYLESVNLLQLCIDILGQPHAEMFQKLLGYDSEFEKLNAYIALKTFKKDLFSANDFFVLKKGFSSLIKALQDFLETKDNVTIELEKTVTDIGKNYVELDKLKRYGSRILCCVPYYTLKQLPKFKDIEAVDAITPIPLIRIYAKYPKDKSGKVWFHGLKRTITDNYIRQIIPIDYETGLIMISYTDGKYANMWKNLSTISNKVLIEHLHKEVKNVLGKEPPKPEFITSYYWKAGVHMWKPGISIKDTYESIINPFPKIYVVNEAYSLHQCWVEGALDASYDVLDLLDEKFIRGKPKVGGDKKRSKMYTIKQVLKKRNWIVLDIRGKLRIYDVGGWLKDHPGGSENLRKGIKANRYYVDKKKYTESPIMLFKQIGAHGTGKVIQKMLMTKNDKVEFIGLMKKV